MQPVLFFPTHGARAGPSDQGGTGPVCDRQKPRGSGSPGPECGSEHLVSKMVWRHAGEPPPPAEPVPVPIGQGQWGHQGAQPVYLSLVCARSLLQGLGLPVFAPCARGV